MDLARVQFHNPCYGFRGKACAKYFRDYTKEIVKRKRYQVPGRPAPIHSALLGGTDHQGAGLTRPKLDFNKPGARRHSTGIPHSVHFTGTRHHLDVWPVLAPGTSLILCRVLGLSEDFGFKS